ncbi:PGF-pre-PGF domain-containing protein, partial [Candidatus Micrarchaeota archaeon]|nr:PGF-pre-PGF domain-containing protein [Candidatus Micrarchaeota archaeon]
SWVVFSNTTEVGRYNVTFYANNSVGDLTNVTDYFESFDEILFNFTVINSSLTGINSSWNAYYNGSLIANDSSPVGNYSENIRNALVSLEFTAFNPDISVVLNGVNLSTCNGMQFGIDQLEIASGGYLRTFGVNSSCPFANATVKLSYNGLAYFNESRLGLTYCPSWNFAGRACNVPWADKTWYSAQNMTDKTFSYFTTAFSGFSIFQQPFLVPGAGPGGGPGSGYPPEIPGNGTTGNETNATAGIIIIVGNESYVIPPVESGENITVDINGLEDTFLTLEIISEGNISTGEVNVTYGNCPAYPPYPEMIFYKCLSIDVNRSKELYGKSCLSFRIPNTWVNNNNANPLKVTVRKHGAGGLQELEATLIQIDTAYKYYQVCFDSFSDFAVYAEKKCGDGTCGGDAETCSTCPEDCNQCTVAQGCALMGYDFGKLVVCWYWWVLLAFVLALIVIRFLLIRRSMGKRDFLTRASEGDFKVRKHQAFHNRRSKRL